MKRHCILGLMALSGCAASPEEINRAPELTEVGRGLEPIHAPVPLAAFPPSAEPEAHSMWSAASAGLYRDARARHVGDILTVEISIDEGASLDNRSDRSRDSTIGVDLSVGIPYFGISFGGGGATDSQSASEGRGSIDRSERLDLTVAAVVTSVLPNGNLVISGTQEVRVNHEMRVLSIAGIVRPRDVSTSNTISYDKIAEARLSYGGRGRITEVQQPPYGQQIYDLVTPF